ncbi:serine/threonine protein kinase [Mesobacillus maritimus]|uniref:non-specific serine/threonine protein kinase n=1 Tax=Mesobacillus maritimus TaxID=1643336 RepID=A0ABS7K3I4_9BACI|nr:protein kinase [Mesobacillus maritimus]MBY0096705.1 protein kinase [Mesobacillus maritimus]
MFKSLILSCSDLFDVKFKAGDLIDDRYRAVKWLGTGGYGRSFLVEDLEQNELVVLKALRFHKRMSSRGRKGFILETDMLRSLDNASLPKVHSIGEANGVPYFTMDYINGKTFEQLIFSEGKRYEKSEVFRIGIELLQIIGYIHNQGIVHRDIRIPNVMVENNHQLKLIDFGLARRIGFSSGQQPRRVNNKMKDLSFQSDFYALGHFILFLLYSCYETEDRAKERSWEEELQLPLFIRSVLRRLLQLDEPYERWQDIQGDFFIILNS